MIRILVLDMAAWALFAELADLRVACQRSHTIVTIIRQRRLNGLRRSPPVLDFQRVRAKAGDASLP
jgi:hypothetical protein